MSPAAKASDDPTIGAALKGVEVERIVGPGKDDFIQLGSLWNDQPVVLHFLRRFGCRLCRGGAMDMSEAIPHLRQAGVRVAAVGPEPLGLDEFVKGKYWAGELYVDDGKKAYKALQLRSLSYMQCFYQLFFNSDVKKSIEKTKDVQGNFAGDGMQLGATFVFDKGGKLLASFKQETVSDHPSPEELLKLFNIDPTVIKGEVKSNPETCEDNICK